MPVYEDSRYVQTPLVTTASGVDRLLIRNRTSFSKENATSYIWKEGDTLDGLAYKMYDNTDFRWAILDANPQYKSEFNIQIGDVLIIPDYEEVVEFVNG